MNSSCHNFRTTALHFIIWKSQVMSRSRLCHVYVPTVFVLQPGVNFTKLLQAAFTCADPKSAKKLSSFIALLWSVHVKAAHGTLVKLTLDSDFSHFMFRKKGCTVHIKIQKWLQLWEYLLEKYKFLNVYVVNRTTIRTHIIRGKSLKHGWAIVFVCRGVLRFFRALRATFSEEKQIKATVLTLYKRSCLKTTERAGLGLLASHCPFLYLRAKLKRFVLNFQIVVMS